MGLLVPGGFGNAFDNNGMRYPGDDREFAKEDADAVQRIVPVVVIMARANIKIISTGRLDLDESDNNRFNVQVEVGF